LTVYGSGGGKYYLAYQQGTTEVKYFGWGINSAYGSQESATISTGSGATSALYPSISQNVGNIIVSWTGNVPSTTNCFIRRRPYGGSWSTFQQVGSFMNYTNNNTKSGTTEDAVIGWWDTYGNRTQFIKLVSGVYGTVTTLPITGLFHISNGTSFSAMKAVIFNSNGSAPYAVNPLTYNFLTLQKETTNPALVFGRKAVVSLGETELVYCLENIKLDGENILFSGFNTAAQIKTIDDLNNLLSTDKFSLNKGSKLQFSSIYYPVRTELADSSKKEKCKINFRTELVSADDRKSISKFRDLLINKNSINDSGKVNINLDCSSIKEGEYYLRIVVDNSADVNAEYTVSDIQYEKTDGLPKGTNEELSSSGNTVVKSYDLSQNYPNPFNPSTVINYQIPEAGGVTLKVYDVLGKEVAALVDGRKDVGKYSVGFNASNLTSGIYLYELRSNDYTSSKKMILVK
ncbi:MAG: T9SS type A sorting domain-containing protein, partial [Ignavibacteriales bacterium]|nr:T9SS type A sorting domain-containing protein [Ignavibacteriales bacterium]